MDAFIQRHREDVMGCLSGFDRLRFQGTLRSISYGQGLDRFLGAAGVRYKDFGRFAQGLSDQLKKHAERLAMAAGRPYQYVSKSSQSKEDIARAIAERDGVTEGLVCVLRCVEPCMSFSIRRNVLGRFGFLSQERKCLHLYFYYMDRDFGLMHVRLATWLPFGIQVCLNGREYLARRYRALRPVSREEAKLFEAVLDARFLLEGFRNGHLRERLAGGRQEHAYQARRASARITRMLRLLRAHRLIRKVSGTRYSRVTPAGHRIMTAALKLRDADVAKLAA